MLRQSEVPKARPAKSRTTPGYNHLHVLCQWFCWSGHSTTNCQQKPVAQIQPKSKGFALFSNPFVTSGRKQYGSSKHRVWEGNQGKKKTKIQQKLLNPEQCFSATPRSWEQGTEQGVSCEALAEKRLHSLPLPTAARPRFCR